MMEGAGEKAFCAGGDIRGWFMHTGKLWKPNIICAHAYILTYEHTLYLLPSSLPPPSFAPSLPPSFAPLHVAVTEAGKKGDSYAQTFFVKEYTLNHLIGEHYPIIILMVHIHVHVHMYTYTSTGTFKKPFIAIQDGITMGGVSY